MGDSNLDRLLSFPFRFPCSQIHFEDRPVDFTNIATIPVEDGHLVAGRYYPERLSPDRKFLQQLSDLETWCNRFGIQRGRLIQYGQAMGAYGEAAVRGGHVPENVVRDLHESIYSIFYLYVFWSRFGDRPEFNEKIRTAMGGSAFVRDERDPTARNAEFELHCAALMESAGFPCKCAEPDLVFEVAGRRIGLAAKRLVSGAKLSARFREAQAQSLKQNLPCFAVMDLTRLYWPRLETVFAQTTRPIPGEIERPMRHAAKRVARLLTPCDPAKAVAVMAVLKPLMFCRDSSGKPQFCIPPCTHFVGHTKCPDDLRESVNFVGLALGK